MSGIGNVLTKIFGGSATEVITSVGSVIDNLTTSKEEKEAAKLAIQVEVNRHMETLQNNLIKEKELDVQDRSSARTREAEFVKATGHADYFQYFIGGIAVITMVGIVIFILNKTIPDKNDHVVMLVIGELLGIVTAIYSFHYGSSQGSRLKDRK